MLRPILIGSTATLALAIATPASADSAPCDNRVNNTVDKLLECMTIENLRAHQAAFQEIADANGGTRQASTEGYDQSGFYIGMLLEEAGYNVTYQPFQFPFFEEVTIAVLEQISPVPTSYVYFDVTGFATMTYSGSGDATAEAEAVDFIDPTGLPANSSTSACEASDFAAFTPGRIAIVQRGSCSFAQKA